MATLPEGEIFRRPTVKEVVFQVRFPTLFYIESKIGDFQLKILNRFPDSEFSLRPVFAVVQGKDTDLSNMAEKDALHQGKLWTFKSKDNVTVEVKRDAVTILTEKHKSYRTGEGNFRDVIHFVLDQFGSTIPVPMSTRVGLRYVDLCPIPKLSTDVFKQYYNSAFPVGRFPIEHSSDMAFRTVAQRGDHRLIYQERIQQAGEGGLNLIVDMDAFAENIEWARIKETTDALYLVIKREFEATITDRVLEYMRGQEDAS